MFKTRHLKKSSISGNFLGPRTVKPPTTADSTPGVRGFECNSLYYYSEVQTTETTEANQQEPLQSKVEYF